MKNALSAAVVAAAILVAACSGGGGGGTAPKAALPSAPLTTGTAVPSAGPVSGTRGTISLIIPASKAAASSKRSTQFISSGALSAVVTINGGPAASYDLSALSPNCTPVPSGRACTIAIGVPLGTGSAAVTLSLWDGTAGTGTMLGSGTGNTVIPNGATSFTVALDVSPIVAGVAFSLTFPSTGLPRISLNHVETGVNAGAMVMTFTDPDGVVIPATSSSSFLNPITLSVVDPSGTVSLSQTNIVNPTQTTAVSYTGGATLGSSVTFNATTGGATLVGTLVSKTSGYQTTFSIGNNGPLSKEPYEIIVGSDGFLWFTEFNNWAIGKMDPANPALPVEFPVPVLGNSPQPIAITAGPVGDAHVWYTEPTSDISGGVGAFGNLAVPSGATSGLFPTGNPNSGPNGIRAVGANIWISLQNLSQMAVVDTTGAPVPSGPGTPPPGMGPTGIAAGSDGNVYVAGLFNGTVLEYSPIAPYPILQSIGVPAGAGSQPAELVAGPDSAIWFTEHISSKIGRIANGAATATEFALPPPFVTPWAIVEGSDGGIWFAASEPGFSDIVRIDPTTKAFVGYRINSATTQSAFGLASGPDGNLWMPNLVASTIVRIQP